MRSDEDTVLKYIA